MRKRAMRAKRKTLSARKPKQQISLPELRASAEQLAAAGRADDVVELLMSALTSAVEESSELALLLAKLRAEREWKRSERIDPAQLALHIEEFRREAGEHVPELEAESERELDAEIAAAEAEVEKPRRPRNSWRTTGAVSSESAVYELSGSELCCKGCGRERKLLGHDDRRIMEYEPPRFVIHERRVARYACGVCKDGVVTAAAPKDVPERVSAGPVLLSHVVVSKYADHCPLTRLSGIYARSGVEIPVSTMSDWVRQVAERVAPVVGAIEERVKASHVIGTDATGLMVLDPRREENIQQGTVWCYVGDRLDVVYKYAANGSGASGPWEFLRGRKGYVQADAASVFDRIFSGEVARAVEVGCWAHARRKFLSLESTDMRVAYPVQLIARLYRVEHLADARRMNHEERRALRVAKSGPILEKLRQVLVSTLPNEPPKSELAKACAYVINHWDALSRFLEDGRLLLDNNITEQQLRSIAIGRKNYLFAGSHEAAADAAVLYSLLRTAAQHNVAPIPYLSDILLKLSDNVPADELTPDNWQLLSGIAR